MLSKEFVITRLKLPRHTQLLSSGILNSPKEPGVHVGALLDHSARSREIYGPEFPPEEVEVDEDCELAGVVLTQVVSGLQKLFPTPSPISVCLDPGEHKQVPSVGVLLLKIPSGHILPLLRTLKKHVCLPAVSFFILNTPYPRQTQVSEEVLT